MKESRHLPRLIRFGEYKLDTRAGELRKGDATLLLHEQPLQILLLLLEHPGELVTREELRAALWPSHTFVAFQDSLNHAIERLREALGDSAENPRFIETVARRGYRFINAVDEIEQGPQREKRAIKAVAVLPLENLTGDPAQDYFVDGMTDELICTLAQIGSLQVVSRSSVMTYKGASKTLPEIARELTVDAVVEGTVARSGNRVRITAQLVEAETDRHLWAETYERDLRDILALQSEIARRIAAAVQVKLTPPQEAALPAPTRSIPRRTKPT
jgi:TolB-like protein